jgi:hypothetical protein
VPLFPRLAGVDLPNVPIDEQRGILFGNMEYESLSTFKLLKGGCKRSLVDHALYVEGAASGKHQPNRIELCEIFRGRVVYELLDGVDQASRDFCVNLV